MQLSYSTVCQNRTHHLKQVYRDNVLNNRCDTNEFILLNWNSKDDMHEWVEKELKDLIKDEVIKYYIVKETGNDKFNTAHAFNAAVKLSSGKFNCNLIADNIIDKGFNDNIYELLKDYSENKKFFIMRQHGGENHSDCTARCIFSMKDYDELGGYNERLVYWGYFDDDLFVRARMYRLKVKYYDAKYNKALRHGLGDRLNSLANNLGGGVIKGRISGKRTNIGMAIEDRTKSLKANASGWGICQAERIIF